MVNESVLIYERPTNVTSAPDFFFRYPANTLTNGAWGHLILIMVFTVSYLSLSSYNSRRAFAAASYLTFGTCVVLATFGIVGTYAFTLTGLMAVASLLVNRGGENIGR